MEKDRSIDQDRLGTETGRELFDKRECFLPAGTLPNVTSVQTVTTMLMEVKADSDLSRSTRVYDSKPAAGAAASLLLHLRDTTGPFECGEKGAVTCLPATTTGVSPGGSHPFLLYARHGTFELYLLRPILAV